MLLIELLAAFGALTDALGFGGFFILVASIGRCHRISAKVEQRETRRLVMCNMLGDLVLDCHACCFGGCEGAFDVVLDWARRRLLFVFLLWYGTI